MPTRLQFLLVVVAAFCIAAKVDGRGDGTKPTSFANASRFVPKDIAATANGPQEQSDDGGDLKVRIVPLRNAIVAGETLQLRVEFWNTGNKDFFLCKDILEPSLGCSLKLTFEPHGKGEARGSAGDCVPWGMRKNPAKNASAFEKEMLRRWVLLQPKHFYGTVIPLYRDSNNHELEEPGTYRLRGGFTSGGMLSTASCNELIAYPEEVAQLPAESWKGQVETNTIVIRVITKTK
jgi:hypothetical protein